MMGRLKNKVALVTGGCSGIGRASAMAFAGEGARVSVADVDAQGGKLTVAIRFNNSLGKPLDTVHRGIPFEQVQFTV